MGLRRGLLLAGPVKLSPAEDGGQGCIKSATGIEHYFSADGAYDGWGMDVSQGNLGLEDAAGIIAAIESEREIIPPKKGDSDGR